MTTTTITVPRQLVADDGCQIISDTTGNVVGHVRRAATGRGWWWHLPGEDVNPITESTRAAAVDAVVRCLATRADLDADRVRQAQVAAAAATAEAATDPAVEFVRLGFREHVSIDFRVPVRTPEQLRAMAEAAWCTWAESFLADVWPICSGVEIGREGSAVLYVDIPATRQQAHGGDGKCVFYSDDERMEIARKVIAWAKSAGADEISTEQHGPIAAPVDVVHGASGDAPRRVRIWWD